MPATDTYEKYASGLTSPATRAFAITPHDTNELAVVPRAVYCSVTGQAVVVLANDTASVTLVGMIAGMIYPIRPKLVTTATTATLVGLY